MSSQAFSSKNRLSAIPASFTYNIRHTYIYLILEKERTIWQESREQLESKGQRIPYVNEVEIRRETGGRLTPFQRLAVIYRKKGGMLGCR